LKIGRRELEKQKPSPIFGLAFISGKYNVNFKKRKKGDLLWNCRLFAERHGEPLQGRIVGGKGRICTPKGKRTNTKAQVW